MYQIDDWRDEALYPDLRRGTVPLDVWAWEFVRRNASFRSDFDALIRPVWQELSEAKLVTGYQGEWKHESAIEAWIAMPKRAIEIPLVEEDPPSSLKLSLAPRSICELGRWKRWQISINDANVPLVGLPESRSVFSEELGAYKAPTEFIGAERHFIFCHSGYATPGLKVPLDRSELNRVAWVKLDLRRTIESQIDAISVWAREAQKVVFGNPPDLPSVKKPRTSYFASYLRILDGMERGIPHAELARFLYPSLRNEYPDKHGVKKVENALTAAKKMRDGGWRHLLMV